MTSEDGRERVDGRVERARRRREQTKDQILLAASRCFSRRGYHATSIQEILDDAGVARGTFYLHFQSKQQIFEELMGELLVATRESLPRLALEEGAPSILDQLVDNLCRLFDVLMERRFMVTLFVRGAIGQEDEIVAKVESVFAQINGLVERSIATGVEMGVLRPVSNRAATLLVVGAIKEALLYTVKRENMDSAAFRELIRELAGLAFGGLGRPE